MSEYTRKFSEISVAVVALVGGKNASLGDLYRHTSSLNIKVPDGFATTVAAFRLFLTGNGLIMAREQALLDRENYTNPDAVGSACRQLLLHAALLYTGTGIRFPGRGSYHRQLGAGRGGHIADRLAEESPE